MSYPKRKIDKKITNIKKLLTIEFPFLIANFEPTYPPNPLEIAIGIAIDQITFPLIKNKQIEPKLVARFTNLACVLALKKSIFKKVTKQTIKKVPVPGPIKPSYNPTIKQIRME